ncbi:MAG: phosphoribosylglycinamide formyltransferase [Ignavibacteria bacterium]|nr:phosphoribosylglycinamide formyltransferase [Ignavibacteria bacterium]
MKRFRIGVFASGRGSNLQAIIDAIEQGELNCEIAFVLSNNSNSGALEIARSKNIPAIHLSEKKYHKENFELSLIDVLENYKPDLIVLAGYMKLVPSMVIERFRNKIINIHPALLPKYGGKGMFGINVHRAVFESNEKESGVTVHVVNEKYDEGKILYQEKIDITDCNSPEEIAQKVLKVEHRVYPQVIQKIVDGKISLVD